MKNFFYILTSLFQLTYRIDAWGSKYSNVYINIR